MKITSQEEYGLRCLLRLAAVEDRPFADHSGDRGGGRACRFLTSPSCWRCCGRPG